MTVVLLRVLVVGETLDDREQLTDAVEAGLGFAVAGSVASPAAAVASIRRLKPAVVVVGCRATGFAIETTATIMSEAPVPIVLVARDTGKQVAQFQAAGAATGALAAVGWPSVPAEAGALRDKLRVMAGVGVVRRWKETGGGRGSRLHAAEAFAGNLRPGSGYDIVAIAGSTGAPGVMAEILGALTPDFASPVLIVQHLTEGFADSFARWLGSKIALPVTVAIADVAALPGHAYVAPDNFHLGVSRWRRLVLSDGPPVEGFRPSGSVLFRTAAMTFGERAIGIVLTGMGEDGATGLLELRKAGGMTVAQDQDTSIVYGMPRQAAAIGAVRQQLPPAAIARLLARSSPVEKDARHAG